MKLSLLVPMLLISCSLNSIAQVFVGITADFGNAVKYSPHDEELLKRSITPSGSVAVIIQELIKENWYLQYGGSIGTLGYKIRNSLILCGETRPFTQSNLRSARLAKAALRALWSYFCTLGVKTVRQLHFVLLCPYPGSRFVETRLKV